MCGYDLRVSWPGDLRTVLRLRVPASLLAEKLGGGCPPENQGLVQNVETPCVTVTRTPPGFTLAEPFNIEPRSATRAPREGLA